MAFDVGRWCGLHLGAPVEEVLFTTGHLAQVLGVRLRGGRTVVVKVRPDSPRLAACTAVQQSLWRAGFPAPEPLAGPLVEPFAGSLVEPLARSLAGGPVAVSAEAYVPGGSTAPGSEHADRFAGLLARLVATAPPPQTVGTLAPELPWTAWNHALPGPWPAADDRDDDLNAAWHATPWLDETGMRVRARLRRFVGAPAGRRTVIGHGDWEAQNLRWDGDAPLVVHDWDSVTAAPEAVLVGLAASVWPCGMVPRAATVAESAAFLEAYQRAAGRAWSADEIEAGWAAGLWVYAYNTKKASLDGQRWLSPAEAGERLALAGA